MIQSWWKNTNLAIKTWYRDRLPDLHRLKKTFAFLAISVVVISFKVSSNVACLPMVASSALGATSRDEIANARMQECNQCSTETFSSLLASAQRL